MTNEIFPGKIWETVEVMGKTSLLSFLKDLARENPTPAELVIRGLITGLLEDRFGLTQEQIEEELKRPDKPDR